MRRVASEDAHTVPQAQAERRKLLTNRETDSLPEYDPNRKTYRCWFFMLSGFYWEPSGTWDESSQTFTFKGRLGAGDTGTMTATMRFSDEATFVCSLVATDPGGKVNYQWKANPFARSRMPSRMSFAALLTSGQCGGSTPEAGDLGWLQPIFPWFDWTDLTILLLLM